ncbi:hypothetical protein EKO27_g1174 [Xylaria grammica]|uniref:Uncharacterized protein n=1 Tax=Xylaria grammica TaxID=363999 RepID=A0A439DHN6_9PEZI|nr:hypothetical protein EKO27_g1174 [Xylaria grammica]
MRFTIAAVLAGVAAAAKALDPSWSFASTTTIIDKDPWYTVNVPFLSTITTSVSGTIETVTKTEVSISIGTKSPSTLVPDTPTNCLADPCEPVHESGGVVARQVLESTEELITYTHSHPQSSTIDDSDVLPTTIPVGGYGAPIPSFTADETVTTVTSSEASPTSHSSPLGYGGGDETSSEASPTTYSSPLGYGGGDETVTTATPTEVSLTTHSSPLGYGGGDETSSTLSNVQVTATVTVTVSAVAPTTTTSTSKPPAPSTLTFTVTYGSSPVETILFTTVVGSSSVLGVTGTATSVTSDVPSMSILPYPPIDSSSPPGGYGGEESSSTIPITSTGTVDIPPVLTPPLPPTTAQESTTFVTVKVTSTYSTTTSSGASLPPYGSSTAEPVTGTPSSVVTLWPQTSSSCDEGQQTTSFSYAHPTVTGFLPTGNMTINTTGVATGNATYIRTWSWSTHHPHLSLPTQGASTLVKVKRGAKNTVIA